MQSINAAHCWGAARQMYNLFLNVKRVAALGVNWQLPLSAGFNRRSCLPKCTVTKGTAQSVMEDILEPLMVFSAGQERSHAMQEKPDCLKCYTNDT